MRTTTLAAPPPVVTACLACGWAQAFPRRCPRIPTSRGGSGFGGIEGSSGARVGKANTILMVPNDGPTLSNGTVNGAPSGLHGYAGEKRFVFVLRNVTNGVGDIVSHDL